METPLLIENFITQTEHDILLNFINNSEWDSTSLSRRVQHYGYKYAYKTTNYKLEQAAEIPKVFVDILYTKLIEYSIIKDTDKFPNQCIVNEYMPGQGIGPHTDHQKLFGEIIISITLGSQCIMNFSCNDKQIDCILPICSAVILTGDFRYKYKHAIKNVKSDFINGKRIKRGTRVSITLRYIV